MCSVCSFLLLLGHVKLLWDDLKSWAFLMFIPYTYIKKKNHITNVTTRFFFWLYSTCYNHMGEQEGCNNSESDNRTFSTRSHKSECNFSQMIIYFGCLTHLPHPTVMPWYTNWPHPLVHYYITAAKWLKPTTVNKILIQQSPTVHTRNKLIDKMDGHFITLSLQQLC